MAIGGQLHGNSTNFAVRVGADALRLTIRSASGVSGSPGSDIVARSSPLAAANSLAAGGALEDSIATIGHAASRSSGQNAGFNSLVVGFQSILLVRIELAFGSIGQSVAIPIGVIGSFANILGFNPSIAVLAPTAQYTSGSAGGGGLHSPSNASDIMAESGDHFAALLCTAGGALDNGGAAVSGAGGGSEGQDAIIESRIVGDVSGSLRSVIRSVEGGSQVIAISLGVMISLADLHSVDIAAAIAGALQNAFTGTGSGSINNPRIFGEHMAQRRNDNGISHLLAANDTAHGRANTVTGASGGLAGIQNSLEIMVASGGDVDLLHVLAAIALVLIPTGLAAGSRDGGGRSIGEAVAQRGDGANQNIVAIGVGATKNLYAFTQAGRSGVALFLHVEVGTRIVGHRGHSQTRKQRDQQNHDKEFRVFHDFSLHNFLVS